MEFSPFRLNMGPVIGLETKRNFIMVCLTNLFLSMNFYLLMVIFSEYAMKKFDAPQSLAGHASSIFVIGALVTILKMFLTDCQ